MLTNEVLHEAQNYVDESWWRLTHPTGRGLNYTKWRRVVSKVVKAEDKLQGLQVRMPEALGEKDVFQNPSLRKKIKIMQFKWGAALHNWRFLLLSHRVEVNYGVLTRSTPQVIRSALILEGTKEIGWNLKWGACKWFRQEFWVKLPPKLMFYSVLAKGHSLNINFQSISTSNISSVLSSSSLFIIHWNIIKPQPSEPEPNSSIKDSLSSLFHHILGCDSGCSMFYLLNFHDLVKYKKN